MGESSVFRRLLAGICWAAVGLVAMSQPASASEVLSSKEAWVAVLVTVLIVMVCITLHYEVFNGLSTFLVRLHTQPRSRILFLILGLMALHVFEIWIFAAGYFFLTAQPGLGSLSGAVDADFLEYVYYSSVVYTTLGFGDLIPHGNIRFLTGTEALMGLMLITWSASFTFLEMQKFWNNR